MIIVVALLGVLAVFALQNPGIVEVRFFTLSGSTSIPVLIILAFGGGLLAGFLGGLPSSMRKGRRIRELERELDQAKGASPPPPVP